MMTKIMLDLETMGTGSDAVIIAIGAVAFREGVITHSFYKQVNMQSAIDLGCSVNGSTVMWWLKQSDEARKAFEENDKADTLADVLVEFSKWCLVLNPKEMWGNGSMFDNTILSNAYRTVNIKQPWGYWADRCYRTVSSMYSDIKFERVGIYHNAVDDARSQALHLIKILNKDK